MKTQIFVQARMGSSRLPGKVLFKIGGKTIFSILVERLRQVRNIDKIILATSIDKNNDELVKEAKRLGIDFLRGSEENLLDRFYQASLKFKPDIIIRITADCPLIDFNLINKGFEIFKKGNYDILSNARIRTFPDGMDFEIFKTKTLEIARQENFSKFNKNNKKFNEAFLSPTDDLLMKKEFKNKDFINKKDLSGIRLTLDYKEDFEVIKKVYENLYKKNKYFNLNEILKFLNNNPNLYKINKEYVHLDYGFGNFKKQYAKRYKNRK